ncbi:MAG: hypothetical protein PVH61_13860 [Candidatus Aminicenantes bacterium]|jgi:hypothetical protein
MNLKQLQNMLKAYLEGDGDISYVEVVTVRKYTKKALPAFQDYCIIISPKTRQKKRLSNHIYQYIYSLDIVCIVRNFNPELSLSGEPPDPTGIITMVDDVTTSLTGFFKQNKTTIDVFGDEVSEDVSYDSHQFPDREDHYHETIIPIKVAMKPFQEV